MPGNSFQDGLFKAALAALTAVSTSFAEPACTSAMVASVLEMLSAVYHASFSSMKVLRRINGCNGLATSSWHHLAIDEQSQWLLILLPIRRSNLLEQRHIVLCPCVVCSREQAEMSYRQLLAEISYAYQTIIADVSTSAGEDSYHLKLPPRAIATSPRPGGHAHSVLAVLLPAGWGEGHAKGSAHAYLNSADSLTKTRHKHDGSRSQTCSLHNQRGQRELP